MLELIKIPRDDVVGIRIDGPLSEADIGRIVRAIDAKFELHEKVRIYVEVAYFGGLSLRGLLADADYAFRHLRDFERKAVVSDLRWAEILAKAGDWLFASIQVRHFTPNQRGLALAWIQSDD